MGALTGACLGLLSAMLCQGPARVEVLFPRQVTAGGGGLGVVVRAWAEPGLWIEQPGSYMTAVVLGASGTEVARLALHDDGQPPDAVAADGVWTGSALPALAPGEYTVRVAAQGPGGGGKVWASPEGRVVVIPSSAPIGAASATWLLWAILVLAALAVVLQCLNLAWRGREERGRRQLPAEAEVAMEPAPAPPQGAWREAFDHAGRITAALQAAYELWRSEATAGAEMALRLVAALDNVRQLEEGEGWALGIVAHDLERALGELGYERWEPEVGQPAPLDCESLPVAEGDVPVGAVVAVLAPGYRKPGTDAVQVLRAPLVAVRAGVGAPEDPLPGSEGG